MNQEEVRARSARLEDMLLGGLTRMIMRSNGCSNDSGSCTCELSGDVCNALDVLVPVLSGETEFGREFLANGLSEEEGDAAPALLVERGLERAGDGVFAGVVQTGEEEDETLLVSWGVALTQDLDDFPSGGKTNKDQFTINGRLSADDEIGVITHS